MKNSYFVNVVMALIVSISFAVVCAALVRIPGRGPFLSAALLVAVCVFSNRILESIWERILMGIGSLGGFAMGISQAYDFYPALTIIIIAGVLYLLIVFYIFSDREVEEVGYGEASEPCSDVLHLE